MPKTITSRREYKIIKPANYECPTDKLSVHNPSVVIFGKKPSSKKNQIEVVRSTKVSANSRCNRAVQLAEQEWDPDKIYETNGENRGADITRYRNGVDANYAWCASFFNHLYNPDHVKGENVFGLSDKDVMNTQKILKKAKEVGCFASATSGYKPQVGDALIWKKDSDSNKGHIGIIVEVRDDGSFVTIQGNNNDKIEKIEYSSINDAMKRVSSSVANQTLQGFVQMSQYYRDQHDLAETVTDENDSLINHDSDYCWVT